VKPALKVDADGVSVEFPIGSGGTATVQLNKEGAQQLMTRLGDFSRNPEVRKRFVLGVLDLFMEATKDAKSE